MEGIPFGLEPSIPSCKQFHVPFHLSISKSSWTCSILHVCLIVRTGQFVDGNNCKRQTNNVSCFVTCLFRSCTMSGCVHCSKKTSQKHFTTEGCLIWLSLDNPVDQASACCTALKAACLWSCLQMKITSFRMKLK